MKKLTESLFLGMVLLASGTSLSFATECDDKLADVKVFLQALPHSCKTIQDCEASYFDPCSYPVIMAKSSQTEENNNKLKNLLGNASQSCNWNKRPACEPIPLLGKIACKNGQCIEDRECTDRTNDIYSFINTLPKNCMQAADCEQVKLSADPCTYPYAVAHSWKTDANLKTLEPLQAQQKRACSETWSERCTTIPSFDGHVSCDSGHCYGWVTGKQMKQ